MSRQQPRAFILLAVLIVIGGAVLVATMLVRFAGAESAVASSSAAHAQNQALAFSGIQVVMYELDQERASILEGNTPQVERQYVVYETELELGIVRLVSVAPDGDIISGVGGLLDINRADVEQLVATGLLDTASAEAVVSERARRPDQRFRHIEELLEAKLVDGSAAVLPEELYGPLESIEPLRDAQVLEEDRAERALNALGVPESVHLQDVLTVYSFEPALQRSGVMRINLNVSWSEELARRMDERFGEGTGENMKTIMDNVQFDDDSRIVDVLRFFNVEPERWIDVMDGCTTDTLWHEGRIDLNTAPQEALQSLPGVDEVTAKALVDERTSLSNDERATRVWPVLREIVTPEAFSDLAGRVTTRCWLWQVRLAAGTVDADSPEGPIQNPILYDVVIDLSAPVARIASIRDITGLDLGVRLLEQQYELLDQESRSQVREENDASEDVAAESLFPVIDSPFDEGSFFEDRESVFDDVSDDGDAGSAEDSTEMIEQGSNQNGPRGRWSVN